MTRNWTGACSMSHWLSWDKAWCLVGSSFCCLFLSLWPFHDYFQSMGEILSASPASSPPSTEIAWSLNALRMKATGPGAQPRRTWMRTGSGASVPTLVIWGRGLGGHGCTPSLNYPTNTYSSPTVCQRLCWVVGIWWWVRWSPIFMDIWWANSINNTTAWWAKIRAA